MDKDFEYKVTTIKTSGYTRCGNVSTYWESKPKVIDMSQYIPIEWLRTWFTENGYLSGIALVNKIESDWEKENDSK